MGFYRGPNTVTNGLILSLDAGNDKSYTSGSITWFDRSGNNYTGSLTNGPIFNSANGGAISLDGVDDYVGVSNFIGNTTTFSVSQFIYLNATQNTRTTFSNYGASNRGWVVGIRDDINNGIKFFLGNASNLFSNTILSNNIWYQIVATYDNGSPKIYINGILDASNSNTISFAASYFGNDLGRLGDGRQYFNGRIANTQVYNRALSAAEVLQNYNAVKSRFNLT